MHVACSRRKFARWGEELHAYLLELDDVWVQEVAVVHDLPRNILHPTANISCECNRESSENRSILTTGRMAIGKLKLCEQGWSYKPSSAQRKPL
jgi:hypothetical protein